MKASAIKRSGIERKAEREVQFVIVVRLDAIFRSRLRREVFADKIEKI